MTIPTTPTTTFFGLRQKPPPLSAHHLQAALPAYRPASCTASAAAPSLIASWKTSSSDFSAAASGSHLACAYAAKIAFGIGHLSFSLR
jgi:hypothetical protein